MKYGPGMVKQEDRITYVRCSCGHRIPFEGTVVSPGTPGAIKRQIICPSCLARTNVTIRGKE
jgi:hypothetical protein